MFFTLFFAPLILIIFGEIYGNDPMEIFNNLGSMDVSVPAYLGIIICGVGLISMPIATASSRERGELRRLKLTPHNQLLYIVLDILVYLTVTLVGIGLLVIVGNLRYHTQFGGNTLETMIGLVFSVLSFFSFGFLIAALSPTGRVAQSIGMFLAFPMMFLSGAGMPLEFMPEHMLKMANFLPLKHVVTLMRGLWVGDHLADHFVEVIVLGSLLVVCTILSALLFRWE